MRMGEKSRAPIEAIPTGALALDLALGIGGLPRGRVVEIYGPESSGKSTLAMHVVAEAQRNGGICAYIDAEHAMDPVYAKAIGVDIDELLISQPDTGEQALEIADMLIRSGALDVVVIDSVAALVPRAEIEGEMGDSHVGLQARLMSQALRKLTGNLNKSKHHRDLHQPAPREDRRDVRLLRPTAPGSRSPTARRRRSARSSTRSCRSRCCPTTPSSGAIVAEAGHQLVRQRRRRALPPVHRRARSGGNGRAQFAATENHLIRTPGGWREAGELHRRRPGHAGDDRTGSATQQWQVVLGGLMGDGAPLAEPRGRHGARFRLGHGAKQADYRDWKASLFAQHRRQPRRPTPRARCSTTSRRCPSWPSCARPSTSGRQEGTQRRLPQGAHAAVAGVWYMDDGCFTVRSKGLQERTAGGSGRVEICVEAMSAGTRERLVELPRDTCGHRRARLRRAGRAQKAVLAVPDGRDGQASRTLIAPFVHPSMDYKLLPRFRGRFAVEPEFVEPRQVLVPTRDHRRSHVKPPTRSMHRFDIEVEGTHNYFVDGVMVHNSARRRPPVAGR